MNEWCGSVVGGEKGLVQQPGLGCCFCLLLWTEENCPVQSVVNDVVKIYTFR